jgi:Dolichyl-phosphate-mannose-protein mannosyltransferase
MQIEIKQYINGCKLLLPLLVLTLIWIYVFCASGIIHAGFNYFVDDHQIVLSDRNYTSFNDIIVEPFASLFSNIPKSRFRPLYDVFIRLFTRVYGLSSESWYLSSLAIAILTTGIFYLIGILQKFSYLEAGGFAALIVFGQQSATYSRFGTPETTATFSISLAILCASLNCKNQRIQFISDFLFLLFALAAALNKEACILVLPALTLFKIWNLSNQNSISLKQAFTENRAVALSMSIIFSMLIFYIKFNHISGPGYAGIDRETLSIEHLIGSLTGNGAIFGSALLANVIYLSKYRDRKTGVFYIFIALTVVPQLIIYNKTGMFWHYVLPAAIGVAWLIYYPIHQIGKKSIVASQVISGIILAVIVLQIIFTINYFKEVANRVGSIQSLITDLSNCGKQQDLLTIVGNPYTDSEILDSFKTITDRVINRERVYLTTYGSQKSQLNIQTMQAEEQPLYFLDPESLIAKYQYMTIDTLNDRDKSKIQGIVLTHTNRVEQSLSALNLDWFRLDRLTKKYYPQIDMSVYCKK